jgi:hypothetical protein
VQALRFDAAEDVRRVAFAFDPRCQAVLLIVGKASGVAAKRFYKSLAVPLPGHRDTAEPGGCAGGVRQQRGGDQPRPLIPRPATHVRRGI